MPQAEAGKGRDKETYLAEVAGRWDREALRDARSNWGLFQRHHGDIVALLKPYLADNWCPDLNGKSRNPEGTLTSWLWKCSEANPFIWDFCVHYQRCHLRRGLIIYSKMVIEEMEGGEG